MFNVKENVFVIVKFEILVLYIKKCIKRGLNPTWQGLKTYQNKLL